ncbi:hypothetical protein H4Q26_000148 [Puccinia striiformis f. sp. tritici PST-130]|nr:hypothetical protein H4Q26_000148 [Puccinia striiformis f. sp. tritici PST-130]
MSSEGFWCLCLRDPDTSPTVIHRNTYPTVYLLDATEDKQKKGTWICPKKNIDKAEPSCCGNPMNKFTIARPLWQQYCPPTKAK